MSGWATITVKATSEEDAEALADELQSVCENDSDVIVDGAEIRALDWGYGSSQSTSVLKKNADRWSDAIVMECNDTSDSGHGTYYTSEGTRSSVEAESQASGYEGARGHDAAGELRSKAGFRPFMR